MTAVAHRHARAADHRIQAVAHQEAAECAPQAQDHAVWRWSSCTQERPSSAMRSRSGAAGQVELGLAVEAAHAPRGLRRQHT